MVALSACSASGPEPIVVNKDVCFHCKMNISDVRFGAELITTKGRIYKFDDVVCMKGFASHMAAAEVKATHLCEYTQPGHLVNTDSFVFHQRRYDCQPNAWQCSSLYRPYCNARLS